MVRVIQVQGKRVKLEIDAPAAVRITRGELPLNSTSVGSVR